ncbi:hypothetical protein HDV05_008116, partial [Chytridiales sp. JEL 0842]
MESLTDTSDDEFHTHHEASLYAHRLHHASIQQHYFMSWEEEAPTTHPLGGMTGGSRPHWDRNYFNSYDVPDEDDFMYELYSQLHSVRLEPTMRSRYLVDAATLGSPPRFGEWDGGRSATVHDPHKSKTMEFQMKETHQQKPRLTLSRLPGDIMLQIIKYLDREECLHLIHSSDDLHALFQSPFFRPFFRSRVAALCGSPHNKNAYMIDQTLGPPKSKPDDLVLRSDPPPGEINWFNAFHLLDFLCIFCMKVPAADTSEPTRVGKGMDIPSRPRN